MKSKEEIKKRRDMFKALAQETSSKIYDLDIKIKNDNQKFQPTFLKEKESLHTLLGIANSQWAELMWMLDE